MTIRKEELYGKQHEWGVGCVTCGNDTYKTLLWKRIAGYGVNDLAQEVADRHDTLFDKEHDVVIFEFTPKSNIC